jgi:hypothetical protein
MEGNSKAMRWLFGLPFTGAGILIIWLALRGEMTTRSEVVNNAPFLGILAGLLFLVPGLWVLSSHGTIRFPGTAETRSMLFAGTLFLLMGIFIAIMSYVDDEDAFNAPRWVATVAGALFALVGVLLIKTGTLDKGIQSDKSLFNLVLVAVLFTCFGAIATWVSLGAGEQGFEGSISIPFVSVSTDTSAALGRLCFLPGAIILDVGGMILWFNALRRLAAMVQEAFAGPGDSRRTLVIASAIILLIAAMGIILTVVKRLQFPAGAQ